MSLSSTEKLGAHESSKAGAEKVAASAEESWPTKDFGFIPIPKRLQYNPVKPFHFGILLNMSFGFASTFIVANLYYCQPLLIEFSKSFDVTYEEVSRIPTLVQAGYLVGLLLISPLGDLVRRRQLVLLLVATSTTLTIGLAVTNNFQVFETLSFLVGVATVTPQILMPLAADLAAPDRRASALSVVLSGLMLGVLIARVLAGVIGNFTTWRVVYYMSIGVQLLVFIGAYLVLPDYPSKNRDLTYFQILFSMAKYAVTEPLVIQVAIINIASSACFTSFWVTLTFLLGGPPYYYSTLIIGLFGLVGMLGVLVGPFAGRIIDRLVPWYATLIATCLLIASQAVQTAAGGINVAAVVIACFGLDVARQSQQVSMTTRVLSISSAARARLNAILILSLFIGQVMGTSVGTQVFVQHGWRACSLFMLALQGFQIVVLLLRGPHCPRNHWFGYEGGLEARQRVVFERETAWSSEEKEVEYDKEAQKEIPMQNGEGLRSDTS
ncbi:major facilitator superfamily domain-containing protein [Suillus clintonianus]|uniref:major facilitator superfamily domain-containing protein n=1 Tax=Suillus clintonianus TaxID=1904413 RepID=UPI001B87D3B6|nr:major facilitator superfamily domain-containing protein [Suillus clintonianus]KAG2124592.1 major facilitator superfamily domain-containing protein [Suillus clintonianus]